MLVGRGEAEVSVWGALLVLAGAVFCIARGIVDIRQRRYAWGIVGLSVGLALLVAPVTNLSIKLNLPPPASR